MKKYYHLNDKEQKFEENCQPFGWELGYSESRKKKISQKAKSRKVWNTGKITNENANKKLYHLGDIEKFFDPLNVPSNWIIGATNKRKSNISKSTIGRNTWNKGLTKSTDSRVLQYTINNTNRNKFLFGDLNAAKQLEVKEKIRTANTGKHHSEKTKKHLSEIHIGRIPSKESKIKAYNTKKKNGTFNTSKSEIEFFEYLKYKYGDNNVIHPYKDLRYANDAGYQYECDFYIPSEDLFIELNAHWTHYKEPFNINNLEHKKQLMLWKEKAKTSRFYKIATQVWTVRDVEKLECAKKNNLNYKVIYHTELKNLVNCWKTSLGNCITNETISSQASILEEGSETIESINN